MRYKKHLKVNRRVKIDIRSETNKIHDKKQQVKSFLEKMEVGTLLARLR